MSLQLERFWSKVHKTDGCWNWLSIKNQDGYGRFHSDGRLVLAHRIAYELLVGKIPEGLTIDHLCRNRGCVNPKHLEPVTNRVNVLRGEGISAKRAKQTHCIHGHPLTPENLVACKVKEGHRECRICQNIANTAYHRRKRP